MVVVNKHLPGITVYDAATLGEIAQVRTGVAPHEVAVSADGRLAYVPIYGSSGVGRPGTDEHTLHIFRTSDCTEVAVLDTVQFKRLHSVVVGGSGTVYISAECAAAVILVDPHTKRIKGHIPTGSYTSHFIAVNQEETKLYCSNVQSETVSVLDIENRQLASTIKTGCANQRMTLSPDGEWFVTSLGPVQKVAFYRTSDNQADFQVPVSGTPFVAKFSSDGRYLFSAGMNGQSIHVAKIDVTTRRVVSSTEVAGRDIGSLEVSPFDGKVYISDQPTNQITILDPESLNTVKILGTEAAPDAIAFATIR